MANVNKLNIESIREDFPTIHESVNGRPLIYFDNGATSQKPLSVIEAIDEYYRKYNSNVHRGVHSLSQLATSNYEEARRKVSQFINAESSDEIIFTKGTTDGINLVASCISKELKEGDEIIISAMEHHSNIVPWQMICEERRATLKVIPINQKGELILEEYDKLLTKKTKLVAVTQVSNSLGTINPVKDMIDKAHEYGALVLIDGAQSIQHTKVDVQELNCDFFVFSGHKVYGPTGIGILYGKKSILNEFPPYQGGGDMISKVTFEKTTYNELPFKFEAGTPNIAGAICLGMALDYLSRYDIDEIEMYETELMIYAQSKLEEISGVRIIGTADAKTSLVSFVVENVHPFDVGTLLDKQGIAVRTGHHCTQPLMDFFEIPGTIRASFTFYNTRKEIDIFIKALKKSLEMLR